MIPIRNSVTPSSINIVKMNSDTFKIDFENKKILGKISTLNSLVQSIYKILKTRRYRYAIYDWNYGIEIDDLIGMPLGYVKAELENRIKDALLIDDRIEEVYNFEIYKPKEKDAILVKFSVKSYFGQANLKWEMDF